MIRPEPFGLRRRNLLKLVIGGYYLRRDGKKVGPLVPTSQAFSYMADIYPFRDPARDVTYDPFGFVLSEDQSSPKDLIEVFIEDRGLPELVPTVEAGIWA